MSYSSIDLIKRINKKINHYLNPKALDLTGDREIEWAFVAGHIPDKAGSALDFGCGDMPVGLVAALKGYDVYGIDLTQIHWSFINPSIKFIKGDLNSHNFENQKFDVILNCSTIEHVGLPGRYGSANESDGDLRAMQRLLTLLKPRGRLLMTIPVGQDRVCVPYHRIYGAERLQRLLEGSENLLEEYWIKRPGNNQWVQSERDEALSIKGGSAFYGLGLFVLTHEHPTA
jgi:SAM-dependent methyltransferase